MDDANGITFHDQEAKNSPFHGSALLQVLGAFLFTEQREKGAAGNTHPPLNHPTQKGHPSLLGLPIVKS